MYKYDAIDRQLVSERVEQFRDQVRRWKSGELSNDEFRPLRLQNGLYMQRHAPMFRIAVPYGMLNSAQTTAGALHGLDRRADAEEGTDLVHVDHALVVGEARMRDRRGMQDRRVVHQHIQRTHGLGRGHRDLPLAFLAHVQALEARGVAQLRRERPPRLLEHVRDQHTRALAHKDAHSGGTHAARTAGDQCNLAGQPAHVVNLPSPLFR